MFMCWVISGLRQCTGYVLSDNAVRRCVAYICIIYVTEAVDLNVYVFMNATCSVIMLISWVFVAWS